MAELFWEGLSQEDREYCRITKMSYSWEYVLHELRLGYAQKRASGVLYGHCTSHQEKSPSCAYRPNGMFKCYGCGWYDNMIGFVAYHLGLDHLSEIHPDVKAFFDALPKTFSSDQLFLFEISPLEPIAHQVISREERDFRRAQALAERERQTQRWVSNSGEWPDNWYYATGQFFLRWPEEPITF